MRYVSMSVTSEARDAFRALVFEIIGRAGRRVEMSEALEAIAIVGTRHMEEVIEQITKGNKS